MGETARTVKHVLRIDWHIFHPMFYEVSLEMSLQLKPTPSESITHVPGSILVATNTWSGALSLDSHCFLYIPHVEVSNRL